MFSGEDLIPRLAELNRVIDSAYCKAGRSVAFSCEGCDGVKCCTVDLNLHTFIEMLYVRRGFNTLDKTLQETVLERSHAIVAAKRQDALGEAYRNSVCALNFEGSCLIYAYRPMICRLAGIPHHIVRPDGRTIESGGCSRYQNEIQPLHPQLKIDRTNFYREMASIEIDIIKLLGKRTAPYTIAETLCLPERTWYESTRE
ncbi:MAG TPA: hypothetical protein VK463_05220 [Desulfomonilaceae bacterium]|nr:hypothetical protein [Desulfomonilaceae bacterium]